MDNPETNYRKEFLVSPHHAWLGVLTLGAGFVSINPLALMVGAGLYALGWIYLPDMPFFCRWVDKRYEAKRLAAAQVQVEEFNRQRQALISRLSQDRRQRYMTLATVCRDIEQADKDSPLAVAGTSSDDPRLRKLDELMWTYLKLLMLEENLEQFIEVERRERLPEQTRDAAEEIERLTVEVQELKNKKDDHFEIKQRLLDSRLELLEVLRKRTSRFEQAESNLALVVSEQERLDNQIKLIRADAKAINNTDSISSRINASVEHLEETNKWIAELSEYKDLVGEIPTTDLRVGYTATRPPPIPPVEESRGRKIYPNSTRQ